MAKIIYRCYSEALKDYLNSNGQTYVIKAKDIKTDVPFYGYLNTDKLEFLLDKWTHKEDLKDDTDISM